MGKISIPNVLGVIKVENFTNEYPWYVLWIAFLFFTDIFKSPSLICEIHIGNVTKLIQQIADYVCFIFGKLSK